MSSLKLSDLTAIINKALKEDGRLRKGNNLVFHCPFCNHHKRKLEVRLEEPHPWNCWVCGTKGRGIHSLFKRMKLPASFFSSLDSIVGVRRPKNFNTSFKSGILKLIDGKSLVEEKKSIELPYGFRSLANKDSTIEYRIARNYATKRKLTLCDIIKYNIGYCASGEYANRLVFPSYDKDNNLNFYSCRSYYDEGLKYKNSQVSKNIIGFENLIDFDFPIYLCEGALDAISLRRNAIPLFGKTLSEKLKTAIIESKCPEVNIVLDDDALISAIRIAEWVKSIGRTAKLVSLSGKDPNVLGFENTFAQIRNTDKLDFEQEMKLRLGL